MISLENLGRRILRSMREGKNLSTAAIPYAELAPLVEALNNAGIFQELQAAEAKAAQREQGAQISVRQVLNCVSDAVLLLDSSHTIICGNRRVNPVLGAGRHVLIEKNAEFLAPNEDDKLDLQTRLSLAWNGKPQLFEWSGLRPVDETPFPR